MTDNYIKEQICMVEDCEKPVRSRSLCATHYSRWYLGNLKITPPPATTPKEAGRLGGLNSPGGPFQKNRELARIAGSLGGRVSRRKKKND